MLGITVVASTVRESIEPAPHPAQRTSPACPRVTHRTPTDSITSTSDDAIDLAASSTNTNTAHDRHGRNNRHPHEMPAQAAAPAGPVRKPALREALH